MSDPLYLGIEIGGTKLQLAVGAGADTTLLDQERRDIDRENGAVAILDQIAEAAGKLLARWPVQRIGIGFGGPVQDGIVLRSHQVEGWERRPLVTWCQQQFGLPAVLGNDCDAAALAEATLGSGRGCATVFYVTVGTGVGGGLVLGGRLHGAGRPAVAEIGHLRPGLDRLRSCDTVEGLAAGPGLVAAAARLSSEPRWGDAALSELTASCQGDISRLDARQLVGLAAAGNPIATEAWQQGLAALGWAIAQVITLLAPEKVIVGGGVSLAGESQFFQPLRQYVQQYVFPPLRDSYAIEPAGLGEWVVVHGAIAMAAGPR